MSAVERSSSLDSMPVTDDGDFTHSTSTRSMQRSSSLDSMPMTDDGVIYEYCAKQPCELSAPYPSWWTLACVSPADGDPRAAAPAPPSPPAPHGLRRLPIVDLAVDKAQDKVAKVAQKADQAECTGRRDARGTLGERHPAERQPMGSHDKKGARHTTLMLRCLPSDCTRDLFVVFLQEHGFGGRFDFVYVPCHLGTGVSFGYGFVNMIDQEAAERFINRFQDRVSFASTQGRQANVDRYRNSAIMHRHVEDGIKPALFRDGARIAFPRPTMRLREPKSKRARMKDAALAAA